ncbi:hypothetical protein ACP70R_037951 [Stipagrostis hirtigluma subsp. patula]
MAMKQPLLPITQSSKPSLARRAKERLLHVGQQNLDFAYKRLPAHDKRAKRTLDCLAIVLGFAVSCIFFLALLLYCRALYVGTYWVMEGALGHYQVEVTGVEPWGFLSTTPAPSSPRFDLTARVVNRYWNTTVCLQNWHADVWYAGTPLGKAYFPDTCVEKMADTSVKSSASLVELMGLTGDIERRMPSPKSHGNPKLQIEMRLNCIEYKGRDKEPNTFPALLYWLWCDVAVDMQSPPSTCRIHKLWKT